MNGIIYLATNKINGKGYVGQTTQRWPLRKHQHNMAKDKVPIEYAILKYGREAFKWEFLEENIDNYRDLNILEQFWIVCLKTKTKQWGYNLRDGGLNSKLSEEHKQKISKSRIGKYVGKNSPLYKIPLSKERKRSMSLLRMKKKYPGATFRKIRNKKPIDPTSKCWVSTIRYNMNNCYLGIFHDPVSASLVYKLVWNEIHGDV